MDNKEFKKKFGEKVKKYRLLKNLTQEKLAEKCKCTSQTISGIETGYSFPSSAALINLSNTLNVPLAHLFNFDEYSEISKEEDIKILVEIFSKIEKNKRPLAFKLLNALLDD